MQAIEGAVIACAGLGSRLGLGLPKCLIEVEGQTILSRLIESLEPYVPRIHIVIGYREEMIADYCARHHRDVVLVRNPRFRETNTAYSISLGSLGFRSKVLFMDGDLIIGRESLADFIRMAARYPTLIGVTQAKSENAVLAAISKKEGSDLAITAFSKGLDSCYEWANIFSGAPVQMDDAKGFVYEVLEQILPLPACLLELYEVDTPRDLLVAKAFMSMRMDSLS